MYKLKSLPSFTTWLENFDDKTLKATILGRIKRLELGLKGDTKYVGDRVSEQIFGLPGNLLQSLNKGELL